MSEVWAALLRALAPRDSGSDATDVSGANVLEAAVLVYGVGLMSMLLCSAAYNMLYWTPLGPALRRFDHAAIFLKVRRTHRAPAPGRARAGCESGYARLPPSPAH